ncbi:MAG: hypothetical protein ACOYEC_03960 [Christensenellales bacterium]|jgi:hypothetical protein|nr:hypothetical protein [Clostridiales bacterium]
MKKTIKIIFALLLLCVVSLCFCACRQPDGQPSAKSVTLIIVGKEEQTLAVYERELELNFVSDLFAALVKEQGSSFAYTSTTSAFGQFVNDITISIHPETYQKIGLFPDPAQNEFCAFYHTVDDIKYRDYHVETKIYDNKEFYASAVGINDMPLIDGASYLFALETY